MYGACCFRQDGLQMLNSGKSVIAPKNAAFALAGFVQPLPLANAYEQLDETSDGFVNKILLAPGVAEASMCLLATCLSAPCALHAGIQGAFQPLTSSTTAFEPARP